MDSAWLMLLSLALGILAGGGFTALIYSAAKRGRRAAAVVRPKIPDGVHEVIEALEAAAVVVDASNNVVKVSAAATSMGLVSDAHLTHTEIVKLVDHVRRTGVNKTAEITVPKNSFGETGTHLHLRIARLSPRYVLLVANDHTESTHLDDVRYDFIANVSHELKTPISAVGLLSEALEEASNEPEQVRRFAQRLSTEAQRLNRITQEIIALSRLQTEDTLAKAHTVAVDNIISAAIDQNRVVADAQKVTLVTGGATGLTVHGDEPLLIVALHNLIANAIVYSPENSRVGIGVTPGEGIIEIAVTDQGIGIPEDDLNRVFERFFRVDPARCRHTGGTGLGLSIVKHAVRNHGGEIRVWSQPGRGSTFTIRLPETSTNHSGHREKST
jgi:two-component system sensor histidine kinase SenX3